MTNEFTKKQIEAEFEMLGNYAFYLMTLKEEGKLTHEQYNEELDKRFQMVKQLSERMYKSANN